LPGIDAETGCDLEEFRNGDQKKWHFRLERGVRSDELIKDGILKIKDGDKKIWFAEFHQRTSRLVHRHSSH
jgi:hypothetical protein